MILILVLSCGKMPWLTLQVIIIFVSILVKCIQLVDLKNSDEVNFYWFWESGVKREDYRNASKKYLDLAAPIIRDVDKKKKKRTNPNESKNDDMDRLVPKVIDIREFFDIRY